MISISVYDKMEATSEEKQIDSLHYEEKKMINNFEENLETRVLKNEVSPNGYQNFRIITDEVYDQRVRVRGQVVDQVIRQELYQAYVNTRNIPIGHLITLCKKAESIKVKEIFEERFNIQYEKHIFDILKIIEASTDVRSARFNVQIETVNGITMRGTRVHNTQYYANMMASGQLTGVIVTYDMNNESVTFRISVDGSILLYNSLSEYEILDLIEDLLQIA